MAEAQEEAVFRLVCRQRRFPAYDPFHGTAEPMLWRKVTLETSQGAAAFEQTDYGHAGRLNPWEPRGVAVPLVPQTKQLQAICEAVTAVLG